MVTEKRRGRWKAGESGNPAGRPRGATAIGQFREAIAQHIPEIIDQLIVQAKEGDAQAARILLARAVPELKAIETEVVLALPAGKGLTAQAKAILQAISEGLIAPAQGSALLSALGSVARLKEIDELASRIEALEKASSSPD